jgi:Domain of unknown function (DUF4337)
MEANEVGELREHAEHGASEESMRPVAFTMSILAVLVAITTVLGHRTHTEAVLDQNKATDQWNLYQAKNIRSTDTALASDMLSVMTITSSNQAAADKIAKGYADHQKKWAGDLKEEQEQAEALETKVEQAEARANRFDLGEALLEIALVVSSITLLTKNRIYWLLGLLFGVAGILSAASVLLLR